MPGTSPTPPRSRRSTSPTGDCAAGMCIDFYGRQQEEARAPRRIRPSRLRLAGRRDGVFGRSRSRSCAARRIAPVALAFIEYVLSLEGQKLWNFRPGTPGGPGQYALRRLPVRRDFYAHADWRQYRSDPGVTPFEGKNQLIYHDAWTGGLFQELAFVVRVMSEDTHPELVARGARSSPPGSRTGDGGAPGRVGGRLRPGRRRDQGGPRFAGQGGGARLARRAGRHFRAQYRRAEELAGNGKR